MERVTIGDLKPDLTIVLDVPVEVGLRARLHAAAAVRRPVRVRGPPTFIRDLRDAYRQIAVEDPQRCVLVDADARCRSVASRVWTALRDTAHGTGPASDSASARKTEQETAIRHPRETADLFGHAEAETTLLNAYRSGRIPHAWLIGGPHGIGKATLAYRMARFVLAHPDPRRRTCSARHRSRSIRQDPCGQIAARQPWWASRARAHAQRAGVLRTAIAVDDARETVTFFGATAAAGGWRVCLVDTVDELNANSANALLKVVEEPPPRSLFLLLSNAPAACSQRSSRAAASLRYGRLTRRVIHAAAAASGTSSDLALRQPRRRPRQRWSRPDAARRLCARVQERTAQLLKSLPNVDPSALHALGDALTGTDRTTLATFVDAVERWLIERLPATVPTPIWQALRGFPRYGKRSSRDARDTQEYNLERKPLVFSVFGMLAEAMRMR